MEEALCKRDQMKLFRQDYLDLKGLLEDFPKKPAQTAYVPFGNVAFLKGEFRETNEITVALGTEYYAQYTAKDAVGVIDRRLKLVETILDEMEKEIASHHVTQVALENEDALDEDEGTAVDIREEWTEEDEAFFLSKVGPSKAAACPVTSTIPKAPSRSHPPKDVQLTIGRSAKPADSGPVKSKIVERAPRKQPTFDPSQVIIGKQVKESLFKRRLRDANEGDDGSGEKETLAP